MIMLTELLNSLFPAVQRSSAVLNTPKNNIILKSKHAVS